MQLVLHAGAHFTEEERLLRCLLRNTEDFSRRGIAVPGPGKYRRLLKETLAALQAAPPSEDARDILLDMIVDDDNADRLILSHMYLFGAPRACVRDSMIYEAAPDRLAHLATLFNQDEVELCLTLRNPATFLPALLKHSPQEDMDSFLRGANPFEIRWSDTLAAIRSTAPTVKITVWCFEDMPMIWGDIIRKMAGLEDDADIVGAYDLLSDIMSKEGADSFHAYLNVHSGMTKSQQQRVIAAFLDKFAIDDEIEEELHAPGWTGGDIDLLSALYDEDMDTVARMPGVTVVAP